MSIEFEEQLEKLKEFAQLEGSEVGETCFKLINLWYSRTYLDESFVEHLKMEISQNLAWFEENCTIETREETTTSKYKELVCKYDY